MPENVRNIQIPDIVCLSSANLDCSDMRGSTQNTATIRMRRSGEFEVLVTYSDALPKWRATWSRKIIR
jgi:hypothetical protein